MRILEIPADDLVSALLAISESEPVCLLDSCGVGHLGSHLLIAGISPVSIDEFTDPDAAATLAKLDALIEGENAVFLTLSYEFGSKIQFSAGARFANTRLSEPDVFASSFDALIVHDYDLGHTFLVGNNGRFDSIEAKLHSQPPSVPRSTESTAAEMTFTREQYLDAVETIKERIRCGDTYQTNLTQRFDVELAPAMPPADVFQRIRRDHPAPFATYFRRTDSTVVSASPERFFRLEGSSITTSPIKGTSPRSADPEKDAMFRQDLLSSDKNIAENTMIVDLLRNDLGRVCEYGSVEVEKLCDLEEHPTLFHLVSTVSGTLRTGIKFSDIVRSLFPCGSITGAPKISTMRIIDEIERTARGLSMGAIGYSIPAGFDCLSAVTELSVAIRTMVIRDRIASFNVGGGIVIDSDPADEYDEMLTKSKALLNALDAVIHDR